MEKIPKIKLPVIKLYLDDLERIEEILKNVKLKDNKVLIIRFMTDNCVYDNVKELQNFGKEAINNLEIRYYIWEKEIKFEFDLDLITDITITIRETKGEISYDDHDNQDIIYKTVDIIKDCISRKQVNISKKNVVILKYKNEEFLNKHGDKIKLALIIASIGFVLNYILAKIT